MSEVEFLGARLEKEVIGMVEETAKEEYVDKTKALTELIILGRQKYLLEKALRLYGEGRCSLDKAALLAGITVSEMMGEAAKAGLRSEETIEEYKQGLLLLSQK